jgi:hypothetical protein
MSDSNSSSGGIGVAGLLGVVFITLKLTHNIDWSWWWVLAPFWIPGAFVLALLAIVGVVAGAVKLIDKSDEKKIAKAREARRQARLRKL